jgi:hypothetical protein
VNADPISAYLIVCDCAGYPDDALGAIAYYRRPGGVELVATWGTGVRVSTGRVDKRTPDARAGIYEQWGSDRAQISVWHRPCGRHLILNTEQAAELLAALDSASVTDIRPYPHHSGRELVTLPAITLQTLELVNGRLRRGATRPHRAAST